MKHLLLITLFPLTLWAHGEDKPGPHSGHIKMPGAFHTELKIEKDQRISIYLLDLEFKNPITQDSKVELSYKEKKTLIPFECKPQNEKFVCSAGKNYSLKKGQLIINAIRNKAVGNEVAYDLPLHQFKSEAQHH